MRRIWYDCETTDEHPQYTDLTLFGILVDNPGEEDHNKVYVWEAPFEEWDLKAIELHLKHCDQRIGFNNLNFDDLVLYNHGIKVPAEGTHDAYLAIKTCFPGLPAHGLKFLSWLLLGDPHWKEFELNQTGHKFGDAVTKELREYHRHDLIQHKNIWEYCLPFVELPQHWDAYMLDMRMKEPLEQITFEGGILVDVPKAKETLEKIKKEQIILQEKTGKATKGKVENVNSNKQIGKYLAEVENFELALTATGEFQVKKKDLVDIIGLPVEKLKEIPIVEISDPVLLAWKFRDLETIRKYVKNYLNAAIGTNRNGWIPSAYSISRATTRRTLSKSYYKINFQNSTEEIDEFKLIPEGFLGWFIDSTQVENVVHIYESEDTERRIEYEKDYDWNEYVWLANRILGTNKTKEELDSIKSKRNPQWSVYKEYKTAKLAINFGMGFRFFGDTFGFDYDTAREILTDIHCACPAIYNLQRKVERNLAKDGYVRDVFGHIYTGEEAYKVVAYLIQGCGTGSLPKVQIRANWETLQWWSKEMKFQVGVLNSTTHDECSGILDLKLGLDNIKEILRELLHNMTDRFSPKFDNIPLRAKLYLSVTNWKDRKANQVKEINDITLT